MGHISKKFETVFNNKIKNKDIYFAEWANLNIDKNELEILDKPSGSLYCLHNIQYFIDEGILYIKGKYCVYEFINGDPLSYWSLKLINKYEITEEDLTLYELDQNKLLRNVYLKRRYFFLLFWLIPIKVKYPLIYETNDRWLKLREEEDFEICLNTFILTEK